MNTELRPYQDRAVTRVEQAFLGEKKTALIVLPTGLGKTACMAAIAEKEVQAGGRVLFLAHRTTLLKQAAKEIETMTGIKTGTINSPLCDKGRAVPDSPILLSSIQGMSREDRLHSFAPDAFSLIMIDEAHHILAKSYDKIVEYFRDAKLLGVTATPKRGDDKDISERFNEVSSEYTLCEAINEDWLSPIYLKNCPVKIDISHAHIQTGDYSARDIGDALQPYMEKIADAIVENASDRKVLIFVPLVITARGMAQLLRERGLAADYVAGERKDSPEIMEKFQRGELTVLVNSMLLTEGYNEPSVDCIVNLRVTQSEALLRQIIGRGTRKAEGKENLLILDFFWKNRKGRNSLSVSDILALELGIDVQDLEETVKRCKKYKDTAVNAMELVESMGRDAKAAREEALVRALKRAQEEEERRKRIEESRRRFLEHHPNPIDVIRVNPKTGLANLIREGKAEQISAHTYHLVLPEYNTPYHHTTYYITDLPVFRALGIDVFESGGAWDIEYPSERQSECLQNLGIEGEYMDRLQRRICFVNKGYSGFIISTLIKRREANLCSYKQAKVLCKAGVADCTKIRFATASKAIDCLAKNYWRPNRYFWDLIEEEIHRPEAIRMA